TSADGASGARRRLFRGLLRRVVSTSVWVARLIIPAQTFWLLCASNRSDMGESKSDVLQGTLDLMVLQTLDVMGPLHGYGIARRIEQLSDDVLQLNQGTIYQSLLRLQQRRWISSTWGTSDNNRKAKFYAITKAGRKQ